MRAERLLSILMLLQRYRQMTARDLSERLEVSERTVYRDLEALSGAGVPLYAERGNGGGWFLPEEYRANLPAMSAEELQALILVNPKRLLADLGLQQVAESAMSKLVAGLPARSRQNAVEAWQRLHVDFSGWNRNAEAIPQLPTLQEAVWQERRLQISYERADGETVERTVEPLGLVAKGNVWYVVARVTGGEKNGEKSGEKDGEKNSEKNVEKNSEVSSTRTYRVSRIKRVRLTHEEFTRPPDFDLAQYWGEAESDFQARLPRYPLIVRADPGVVERIRQWGRYSRVESVGAPEVDGWVAVTMGFQSREDLLPFALAFGSMLEVIEPAELRAQVIYTAQQTVARYTGQLDRAQLATINQTID